MKSTKAAVKTTTKTATPGKTAAKTPAKKGFPARKAGTRRAPARKPLPTFEAPPDFTPHFLEVQVRTERDGLLGSLVKATRYQGRYDPDADDKKKADLGSYDSATLIGIQARMSAVTYRANAEKKYPSDVKSRNSTESVKGVDGTKKVKLVYRAAHRLPANTNFRLLFRVLKKKVDGSVAVSLKQVEQIIKVPGKSPKAAVLEKTDPAYRAFRKSVRILPAAFRNVQQPPKRTRGRKVVEEE